jgi:HAD superfamily hydrolase (TIGR01509 family)
VEVPEGRRGIAERCADVYRRVFDELNTDGTVRLFPHVLETIKALHDRGLQLAICSSRGRPTLEGFVKTFRLEHYVSMVVSANDVEHHKPHPEPVQKILAALGVAPREAVVVGDASYDILMGRAAGCRTVGVTYGNQSAADLRAAGADHLIDDFADLLTLPVDSLPC